MISKITTLLTTTLITTLLSGCYSTITIDSTPQGAQIIDSSDNSILGITPVTLEISNDDIRALANGDKCYVGNEQFIAKWKSGAIAKSKVINKICIDSEYKLTIDRPKDAPNISIDILHQSKLQKIRAIKKDIDDERFDDLHRVMRNAEQNLLNNHIIRADGL
jgi:hypothetical protein